MKLTKAAATFEEIKKSIQEISQLSLAAAAEVTDKAPTASLAVAGFERA